jgi:hypothetical protein
MNIDFDEENIIATDTLTGSFVKEIGTGQWSETEIFYLIKVGGKENKITARFDVGLASYIKKSI